MADKTATELPASGGRAGFFSNKLVLLPLAACFSFPVTFFITYGIAVANQHVTPGFPFISDTGTTPPESCVFGQLLNMASVVVALTIYVKYRQLQAIVADGSQRATPRFRRVNVASLWLGFAAAFGVSLVANFQWTQVISVHMVGAFLTFTLGIVYGWLQCWLSQQAPPPLSSKPLLIARLLSVSAATIFFLLVFVGVETGGELKFTVYTFVPSSSALLATTSEWIMSFGLAAVFATFALDFRHIRVASPAVSHACLVGEPELRSYAES